MTMSPVAAVQAGARKVFAVEASDMASFAQKLADKNALGDIVQVRSAYASAAVNTSSTIVQTRPAEDVMVA
jgi:hypothetical protein